MGEEQPLSQAVVAAVAPPTEAVGGVFTQILAPRTFVLNQVGVMDTGPLPIIDGSAWLSASIAVHCATTQAVYACARESDPTARASSTTWCTPLASCAGDKSYTLPLSAFTTDAHHALWLMLQRSASDVTVTSATVTAFSPGS